MTVVVSDSTTLIVLSDMNRFDLLGSIFAKVYIPQTVLAEISSKNNINLPDFIEIELPQDDDNLKAMKLLLDDGESEAIALALQKSIPLIIDEKKGRKIAKNMGLKILGLVGIVYLNITRGVLDTAEARLFLESARNNGFRISEKLINEMFESLNAK